MSIGTVREEPFAARTSSGLFNSLRGGRSLTWAWVGLLLVILGVLVLYPVFMLLVGTLTDVNPIVEGYNLSALTFGNIAKVLVNPDVHAALANSMIACVGGTVIAVTVGLFFSWVVTRTNTPLRGVVETAGVMPLFVPPLVAALAWSLLGSPKTGIVNILVGARVIDMYSVSGVMVLFGIYYAPYIYMFTASALRNMDPSLEEASEVSGVGPFATVFRITLPLIAPAILSGAILAFVVMLGIYGIPAILATPAGETFLTTYIYTLIVWTPPLYGQAAATSLILIVATALCVYLQQRVIGARSYVTVAGKAFKPKIIDLGPWRYATLAFAALYVLIVVILPYLALFIAAFRKFMFIPDVASIFDVSRYSLGHFVDLFANPLALRSIGNSLLIGIITAFLGGALSFAVGYTVHRSKAPGRRLIDFVATVPVAIPGLVIGVAYLWAWVGLPGGLYGTIWILALSFIARFLPDTMKALSSSLVQIHRELEEASTICGRSLFATVRHIVLPLAWPGILSGMTLLFVLSIRELGSAMFLYTNDSIPMSVLMLNLWEGGNIGLAAAFSLVQSALLLVIVVVANRFTQRPAAPVTS
jgi:iron(III) transport system permease protein